MSRQTINPCETMLAVSTLPLIVGLLITKTISDTVIGLGQASEELFRGDRLPVLNLHTVGPDDSNTDSSDR